MDGSNDSSQYSRIPTLNDLITLCRHLNDHGVKYVIIGGFAVIRHGYIRATGDIDLLVENTHENIELLKNALAFIPDSESDKIADDDLDKYQIVRVSGEITVDILAKACEVTYSDAEGNIVIDEIEGVEIPFLDPELLIRTKMGVRPKDVQDRRFLESLLKEGKERTPDS